MKKDHYFLVYQFYSDCANLTNLVWIFLLTLSVISEIENQMQLGLYE